MSRLNTTTQIFLYNKDNGMVLGVWMVTGSASINQGSTIFGTGKFLAQVRHFKNMNDYFIVLLQWAVLVSLFIEGGGQSKIID